MAIYNPSKPPDPIEISKWLGTNEAVGLTGLKPGEALRSINWRITQDYKPQKRTGHKTFIDFGNELDVQGMWHGGIGGVEMLIVCNGGHAYRDLTISGTVYDSLDTATYTNVDVVKTTSLPTAEAGSVNIDGVVILKNSTDTQMSEVALANVDLVASVGKFYFDADEKINYIIAKGTYANIAAARIGLGTTTAYYRIGVITDAPTTIFYFDSKLFFMNGTDFNYFDGTTYGTVESIAYVPTIAIATPPAGGGTDYDPINLLTGKKKQEFVADGTATEYTLRELGLDADLLIGWYDGVEKAETTNFTVNRTTGKVTTLTTLADKTEVIFQWVKAVSGHADLVKKHKYAMTFGPGNDTAIFIWGNPNEKNARRWSGTLKANYFPATNLTLIGSNQFAITDIKPQYNRQIIFKEDRTHYSYPEYIAETFSYDYPVFDLNEKVGNIAFNQVQIVQNNPVSLKSNSWWVWTSTEIEDERNASVISERLRDSLSLVNLEDAATFDNQNQKEYWCNVDDIVYIWNYGNDTMYTYTNITASCFLDINGTIYYGSTGTVERFEGLDDNGEVIAAQYDTGHHAFGSIHLIKTSDTVYIGLLPDSQTSISVYFKTNKINEFKKLNKPAEYRLLDWNDIDFNNYSFLTNRNPQTFALRLNSREFTTIQFRLENAELNEPCVMLDFLLNAEVQGEV